LTFKENCPDLRNSKVIDIIRELESYGCRVHVHDPVADHEEAEREYGIKLSSWEKLPNAHAIVAAVAHRQYGEIGEIKLIEKLRPNGVFTDVKSSFDAKALARGGARVWRL
jgi:UDP-N-acetyl-D-galactosamine dehydrogenase